MNKFKQIVMSKAGKQILTVQKHSPKILFAAGVVGFAATVVMAARATMKIENVLDEHNDNLKKIDTARGLIDEYGKPIYTEGDAQRDTAIAFSKTAINLGKLYGPCIIVGVASIAALTGSHVILSNRLSGLSAAYAALDKGFRIYRERVVAELGLEKDQEFRHADEHSYVEETDEGPIVKTEKRAAGEPSIYARWFDEGSTQWQRHAMSNQTFLRSQQTYCNDLLNAIGFVFLNDVYKCLGLPVTKEGQVVGWVKGHGDDFIDFGMFRNGADAEKMYRWVQGDDDRILLDFNVDGVILDIFEAVKK